MLNRCQSLLIVVYLLVLLAGCAARNENNRPVVELTNIPLADKGGGLELDTINGRVIGAEKDQQVVLFARSGAWYVQPFADQPFTRIGADSTWSNSTHLGTEYAALLVKPGYLPPAMTIDLPKEGGDIIAVTIAEGRPVFWRTWWFRLSLLLFGSFALLAFFRWRMHELSAQLSLRFEERLAERTRIAQDLHDTMLQGMISASMQLHVANDMLEENSPAKPVVNRVVTLMNQVIEEGRDTVRGLRSKSDSDDLQTALSRIAQEMEIDETKDFRVIVEGNPRQLHPVIRDEAYRIGREALVNAFRHSHAGKIEVELEYSPKHLRVLVRDDGTGIDPKVLDSGRDGHWGLPGMRERAETIGAKVTVWSRARAGTEIELLIPGHIAYVASGQNRPSTWLRKLRGSNSSPVSKKEEAV